MVIKFLPLLTNGLPPRKHAAMALVELTARHNHTGSEEEYLDYVLV
jgi:hypothetical protein